MSIIKILKDDFGNLAKIEQTESLSYKGAKQKTSCFRLCLIAEYDNDFVYHVSCYETLEDALSKLSGFSAGTFKEIERKEG